LVRRDATNTIGSNISPIIHLHAQATGIVLKHIETAMCAGLGISHCLEDRLLETKDAIRNSGHIVKNFMVPEDMLG